MYVLAGMLLVGFLCNLLIRPVDAKHHMTEEQIAKERARLARAPIELRICHGVGCNLRSGAATACCSFSYGLRLRFRLRGVDGSR